MIGRGHVPGVVECLQAKHSQLNAMRDFRPGRCGKPCVCGLQSRTRSKHSYTVGKAPNGTIVPRFTEFREMVLVAEILLLLRRFVIYVNKSRSLCPLQGREMSVQMQG